MFPANPHLENKTACLEVLVHFGTKGSVSAVIFVGLRPNLDTVQKYCSFEIGQTVFILHGTTPQEVVRQNESFIRTIMGYTKTL